MSLAYNSILTGYIAKWIKCAARIFALENLQLSQSKETSQLNAKLQALVQPEIDKYKEIRNPTFTNEYETIIDNLTKREQKGCRNVERRVKRKCVSVSKFTCVSLSSALRVRERNLAELNGGMPGEISDFSFTGFPYFTFTGVSLVPFTGVP